ncbi:hypothetical protein ACPOL_3696 [Acidisarcina polymorpha]|uniref:Uncharacterized protein n=1 Tax=Acidisarcina polymorpha TaxID=2211140 RepID=A0A2Z5G2S1_9BACT|nr:hypothetical protein ACPOL_3696 [Acidisarcina polymorpha]
MVVLFLFVFCLFVALFRDTLLRMSKSSRSAALLLAFVVSLFGGSHQA